MRIKVRFFAYLSEIAGINGKLEFDIEEGSNITQFLEALFKSHYIREKLLDEQGELKPDINILINGREIKFLSGMDTLLEPGDEISIFPPVVGG
ncbi:MAG: ubiquitin-like small modifier protein 1 [Candidatus Hodarchaeota archaeon]